MCPTQPAARLAMVSCVWAGLLAPRAQWPSASRVRCRRRCLCRSSDAGWAAARTNRPASSSAGGKYSAFLGEYVPLAEAASNATPPQAPGQAPRCVLDDYGFLRKGGIQLRRIAGQAGGLCAALPTLASGAASLLDPQFSSSGERGAASLCGTARPAWRPRSTCCAEHWRPPGASCSDLGRALPVRAPTRIAGTPPYSSHRILHVHPRRAFSRA